MVGRGRPCCRSAASRLKEWRLPRPGPGPDGCTEGQLPCRWGDRGGLWTPRGWGLGLEGARCPLAQRAVVAPALGPALSSGY